VEPAAAVAQLPAPRRLGNWARALQQVSLPAAAVLVLLVLGGGVSAVVTGDPMAPVNGVTRVVSQFPGVEKPKTSVRQVERELLAAGKAVNVNDRVGATRHLAAAAAGIADLPASGERTRLAAIAVQVQTELSAPGQAPSSIVTTVAPVGVGATTPPVVVVDPTSPPDQASATPTVPVPTVPPTMDILPSTPPPTSDPVPTTTDSTEATPESTPSST
jgi:hypothetical protein